MPLGDRSSLMKRLSEIMPKENPLVGHAEGASLRIVQHPIRQSADAFTRWLDGEFPSDERELNALLWTFGEILCGDMEKRINCAMNIAEDAVSIGKVPNLTLKYSDLSDRNG